MSKALPAGRSWPSLPDLDLIASQTRLIIRHSRKFTAAGFLHIRKFNEENNEEAGEHFTPREVIQDGLLHGNLVPRGPGRSQAIFFATAGRIVQCPRGQILKESRK